MVDRDQRSGPQSDDRVENEGGRLDTPTIESRDPESDTYRTTVDSETDSVALAVISTIAAVTNSVPTELEPLQAVVDVDALENVIQAGAIGHVAFVYHGHEVVVHNDGELEVTKLDA